MNTGHYPRFQTLRFEEYMFSEFCVLGIHKRYSSIESCPRALRSAYTLHSVPLCSAKKV